MNAAQLAEAACDAAKRDALYHDNRRCLCAWRVRSEHAAVIDPCHGHGSSLLGSSASVPTMHEWVQLVTTPSWCLVPDYIASYTASTTRFTPMVYVKWKKLDGHARKSMLDGRWGTPGGVTSFANDAYVPSWVETLLRAGNAMKVSGLVWPRVLDHAALNEEFRESLLSVVELSFDGESRTRGDAIAHVSAFIRASAPECSMKTAKSKYARK